MSTDEPTTSTVRGSAGGQEFCVLLACFDGASGASKVRRKVDSLLDKAGDVILDEVVLRVDAKRKARVFDPRRTRAGLLTSAFTWGVFGLVTGGWESLGLWAVLGAVGGGGWAYLNEHLLTKDQLARIGRSVRPDSSALAVYLQGSNPEQLLTRMSAVRPTTASIATISADLSAHVHSAPVNGVGTTPGQAAEDGTAAVEADRLAMVLVRYRGAQAARDAMLKQAMSMGKKSMGKKPKGKKPKGKANEEGVPEVELLIETDGSGRHRVIDPTTGARITSRGDVLSWGGFGLVCGAIAGYLGTSGILGAVERGFLTAIGWAIFGLIAGALYGLWAGRGVSARRISRMGPILPPDTSTVIAWADDTVSPEAIKTWATGNSNLLTLWFTPTSTGAQLEA